MHAGIPPGQIARNFDRIFINGNEQLPFPFFFFGFSPSRPSTLNARWHALRDTFLLSRGNIDDSSIIEGLPWEKNLYLVNRFDFVRVWKLTCNSRSFCQNLSRILYHKSNNLSPIPLLEKQNFILQYSVKVWNVDTNLSISIEFENDLETCTVYL